MPWDTDILAGSDAARRVEGLGEVVEGVFASDQLRCLGYPLPEPNIVL